VKEQSNIVRDCCPIPCSTVHSLLDCCPIPLLVYRPHPIPCWTVHSLLDCWPIPLLDYSPNPCWTVLSLLDCWIPCWIIFHCCAYFNRHPGVNFLKDGSDVLIATVPFYHVYGQLNYFSLGLYMGATLVILPRFQIDTYLRTIPKYRVSLLLVYWKGGGVEDWMLWQILFWNIFVKALVASSNANFMNCRLIARELANNYSLWAKFTNC